MLLITLVLRFVTLVHSFPGYEFTDEHGCHVIITETTIVDFK